ncbi:MAG TPA: FHA domain-containing protein [Opitutaceae bacterium]|nr:FHA domain-containing protein [Opitutaceae bacterium]
MYTCPQNHQSESPDFCSICGVEIPADAAEVAAISPVTPPPQATGERCPDCGILCEGPEQVYCEVCGFNFRTRTSGVPPLGGPIAPAPVTEALREPALSNPPPEATGNGPESLPSPSPPGQDSPVVRWDVLVEIDDSLYGTKNPDAPVHQPTRTFTLFDDESLIGRAGTEVRAQVPIAGDHGVSRRQAMLVRRPDGGLLLRDLGSTNGTQVNGVDVVPGVDVPVGDGDRIAIGAWTRITLRAVRR